MNTPTATDDFKGTFEIFQNPDFAAILAKHNHLQVLDLDGLIVLLAKSPRWGNMAATIGSPEMNGPFEQWWESVSRLNCAYVTIHSTKDYAPLRRFCVSPSDNHNLYVDLSVGEDELFAQFSKSCQRTIRAGEKKGVTVREADLTKDLEFFYDIALDLSDQGRKFEILPLELVRELCATSFGKLLVAQAEGKVIGGYFFLLTKSIYAWFGGIDKQAAHLSPGNLMMYESMRWGIRQGYKYFDLGQQSLGSEEGIVFFKQSFSPLTKKAYTYQVPQSRLKWMLYKLKNYFRPAR